METKRKTIAEMHTDTRILYNVLEKTLIKEQAGMISYDALSGSIGRDVQEEAMGLLRTARKKIEQDHQVLIEPIIGEGLVLTQDYAGVLDKQSCHIRRQTKKHCQRVLNAVADKPLPPEQKTRVAERLSMLGAVRLFAARKPPKRLSEYIKSHETKELPTQKTIELFAT